MASQKKVKKKDPTCTSISLILCGEPLRKVLGKIGHDKIVMGYEPSKKNVCYELLAKSSFEPTEEMVRAGIEVMQKWVR